MTEHKRLAVIEKALLIVFAGVLIYLAATGALSLSGLDHHWPYPSRCALLISAHRPDNDN